MTTTDLRNATFAIVRQNLSDSRRAVYEAWVAHGPTTTRDLAARSGIDILNVRPRTTDLCELGLVELAGDHRAAEGIYRAVAEARWTSWHADHVVGQQQLI